MNKKIILLLGILLFSAVVEASTQYPNGTGLFKSNVTYSLNESSGTEVFDSASNLGGHLVGTLANQWVTGNTNFSNALRIAETDVAFISGWGTVAQRSQHLMCDNLTINGWYNRNGTTPQAFFGVEGAGGTPAIQLMITSGNFNVVYNAVTGSNEQKFGALANLMPNTNSWYMITLVRNGTCTTGANALDLYINGVRQPARNITADNTMTDVALSVNMTFGASRASTGVLSLVSKELLIDDITIWNKRRLTDSEILTIYNGNYTPPVAPDAISTINITNNTYPSNGSQYAFTQINFNVSVNSSYNFTARLILNGTINRTSLHNITGSGQNVYVNFTVNLTEGNYNYSFFVFNNATSNASSATYIFYVDTVNPKINTSIHFSGFPFSYGVGTLLTGQINFSDVNLYGINITLDDNRIIFNKTNIGTSNYSFNLSLNPFSYGVGTAGVHILNLWASDSHTDNFIPDYGIEKALTSKKITYSFGNGGWVSIKPTNTLVFSSFSTEKHQDRYSFNLERDWLSRALYGDDMEFEIESSNDISLVQSSKYKGHLVVSGLEKWIDFETIYPESKVTLTQKSNKLVLAKISNITADKVVFNSIGGLNIFSYNFSFYVGNVTETYPARMIEGAVSTFTLSFTTNSSYITDINASFWWNGSRTGSNKTTNSTDISFTKPVSYDLPNNLTSNVSFFWEYNIIGTTSNKTANTTLRNVTVFPVILDNCSAMTGNFMNFSVYDETTKTASGAAPGNLTNVTIEVAVNLTLGGENFGVNLSKSGNGLINLPLCVSQEAYEDGNFSLSLTTRYKADNHVVRYYYLQNYTFVPNQTRVFVPLYTLNTLTTFPESSTSFLVNFQDEDYLPTPSAVIDLLREYVSEATYLSVEHGLTDQGGNTRLHVVTEDVSYKAIVRKNNAILYQSSPFFAICQTTPCQINLQARDSLQNRWNYTSHGDISYQLVLNKTARTVVANWATISGNPTTANLHVIKQDARLNNSVCNTNQSGSSGTITCTLAIAQQNTTYYVEFGTYNSPFNWVTYRIFNLNPDPDVSFRETGIIMAMFVTLSFVLMAVPSGVSVVVIFAILGLIMVTLLGFFIGGPLLGVGSSILWLIVAGCIIVWKKMRQDG